MERYDENGEIIYTVDGGPLKNLWKFMSLIENDTKGSKVEAIKFDYNEFFKRLYLSRAELDVTNSVLQLLIKEGENFVADSNISIEEIHHEENENELSNFNIDNLNSFGVKLEILKEISNDLRKTVDSLSKNRQEEHFTVSNVLLELRDKFRWNLIRISNLEQQVQVQVTLEIGSSIIIGIDYSPQVLFKDRYKNSKGEAQYNYNLQIGNENNLALILQSKAGDLLLLFQSKHLENSKTFSIQNLKTGQKNSKLLYQKFESMTCPLNICKWDEALKEARNQSIALNIFKLLSQEAGKYPEDQVQVLYEEMNLKIVIEDCFELSISNEDEVVEVGDNLNSDYKTNYFDAGNIYKKLLLNYLSSSGRELNWDQVRNEIKSIK
jgi:hypothetical protein